MRFCGNPVLAFSHKKDICCFVFQELDSASSIQATYVVSDCNHHHAQHKLEHPWNLQNILSYLVPSYYELSTLLLFPCFLLYTFRLFLTYVCLLLYTFRLFLTYVCLYLDVFRRCYLIDLLNIFRLSLFLICWYFVFFYMKPKSSNSVSLCLSYFCLFVCLWALVRHWDSNPQ